MTPTCSSMVDFSSIGLGSCRISTTFWTSVCLCTSTSTPTHIHTSGPIHSQSRSCSASFKTTQHQSAHNGLQGAGVMDLCAPRGHDSSGQRHLPKSLSHHTIGHQHSLDMQSRDHTPGTLNNAPCTPHVCSDRYNQMCTPLPQPSPPSVSYTDPYVHIQSHTPVCTSTQWHRHFLKMYQSSHVLCVRASARL